MRILRLQLSGLIGTTVALSQIAGLGASFARICFEAESATDVKPPMKFVQKTSNTWSGEGYLEIPEGVYLERAPKGIPPNKGEATIKFTVNSPGSYTVWLRTWWAHSVGNSVFVQVDDQTPVKIGEDGTYSHWHWVSAGGARFKLTSGKHVLKFLGSEDGIKLDQAFLTPNDQYVPEGIRPITQISGLIGTTVAPYQAASLGAGSGNICFEAENAEDLKPPMKSVKKTNKSWSGEGYLEIPDEVYPEDTPKGITPNKGEATIKFTVISPGSYTVWLRTQWPDGDGNSVFVQIDDQTAANLGADGTYNHWHWGSIKGARFKLSAGKHVLKFFGGKGGGKLDQVFLTQDDEYVPEGIRPITQKPS